MNTIFVFLSYALLFSYSLASFEKNCLPAGTPCPSYYKKCMRVRIHYLNASSDPSKRTIEVGESIEIVLPGMLPNIRRYYNTTLVDNAPIDCLVDTDLLDKRTGFKQLNISLMSRDTATNNCSVSLSRDDVVQNPSPTYIIKVTHTNSTIDCIEY